MLYESVSAGIPTVVTVPLRKKKDFILDLSKSDKPISAGVIRERKI